MMNKEQKKVYIDEMTTQFEKTEAVIVTHYQGLTVTQLDELRGQMRAHGIKFKITNNRITKLALEKTKCKELSDLFTGPTAVALSAKLPVGDVEIATVGVPVNPEPSLFKNNSRIYPVPRTGFAVAVTPTPISWRLAIYPTSSTWVSIASIEVSITSSSYSNSSHLSL